MQAQVDPKPYLSRAAMESNLIYWQAIAQQSNKTTQEAYRQQSAIYEELMKHKQ